MANESTIAVVVNDERQYVKSYDPVGAGYLAFSVTTDINEALHTLTELGATLLAEACNRSEPDGTFHVEHF